MIVWWLVGFIFFICFGAVAFIGAPYVPSKRRELRRAFSKLYILSKSDLLLDIGSGDGVVLREASQIGARAVGYEINPFLVVISKILSRRDERVTIRCVDFWRSNFPDDTTIVYTFGDGRDIAKMANKIEREATRIERRLYFMSFGFEVPNRDAYKKDGAYFLYKIEPLHSSRSNV